MGSALQLYLKQSILCLNDIPKAGLLEQADGSKEGCCSCTGGTADLRCAVDGATVLDFLDRDTQNSSCAAKHIVDGIMYKAC